MSWEILVEEIPSALDVASKIKVPSYKGLTQKVFFTTKKMQLGSLLFDVEFEVLTLGEESK